MTTDQYDRAQLTLFLLTVLLAVWATGATLVAGKAMQERDATCQAAQAGLTRPALALLREQYPWCRGLP